MSAELLRLNRELRQVGTRLHPQWWKKLQLESWRGHYLQNELIARRIDSLILRRSGNESFWLHEIDDEIYRWANLLPNLKSLIIAAALLAQDCPDYLWDSQYRHVLQSQFSQTQIEQLIAMWPEGGNAPNWLPEEMLEQAELYAASALKKYFDGNPFWSVLCFSLPVDEFGHEQKDWEVEKLISWIFRLERFL